jgi:hypothetical protein
MVPKGGPAGRVLRSLRCGCRPPRLPYPVQSFEPRRRDPDEAEFSAPAPMYRVLTVRAGDQVIPRRLGRVLSRTSA